METMKRFFNRGIFGKEKKSLTEIPNNASRPSLAYELKDRDLGKLHKAASVGDLAKLKQLIIKQKKDIHKMDQRRRTALHIACAMGHVDVVQFLVEAGADLNLYDGQNRTALMKAVQGQHEHCVSVLLENDAEVDFTDMDGNTALHLAADSESLFIASLLLTQDAKINALNNEGLSPLGMAVRADHVEMAELLLKKGADVNAANNSRRRPLMIAIANEMAGMTRLLLRNSADFSKKDKRRWSTHRSAVMNTFLISKCYHGASSLHQDEGNQKEHLSAGISQAEPASDMNKMIEEFGLGDTDDLQDTSDRDGKMNTPALEETALDSNKMPDHGEEINQGEHLQKGPEMASESGADEPSHDAVCTVPEPDTTRDKNRDFMSELGLDSEESEQESSGSDYDEEELPTVKNETEEVGNSSTDDLEEASERNLASSTEDNLPPTSVTPEESLSSCALPRETEITARKLHRHEDSDGDTDCPSDNEMMKEVYERSQDDPVSPEPKAVSTSESEESEPEEDDQVFPELKAVSTSESEESELEEDDPVSPELKTAIISESEPKQEPEVISSMTDVSDNEGKMLKEGKENENSEEVEFSFEDLTQSSDTASDELDSAANLANLKYQLQREQESQREVTMAYNTTKDKLQRTEEQRQLEIREKQKIEVTLRNQELEMRTLVNNMKQLEEDHSKTQRLLAQERSARTLQDDLLNSHPHKQQEVKEEDGELQQQTSTLQEQIRNLRGELKCLQANSSLKESHLLEENETLKEELQEAQREAKANSDALIQTALNCKHQLTTLKSELGIMTNRFENEKQARETLEKELDSTRTRLATAVQEAERYMAAKADTEKCLLRERKDRQRLKDRLAADRASHREEVSSLSLKLSKAEFENNSLESEQHRIALQLTEKRLLLDVLQKEKERLAVQVEKLDKALQSQTELLANTGVRHEAAQEQLAQAQGDAMLLRQQLDEANNKCEVKEKAWTDAQREFSDILSKVRFDCGERVTLVEDRNKELARKTADLRDQVFKLEEEKACALKDLDKLKDQYVQAAKRFTEKEEELAISVLRLQEAQSASSASTATIKRLEEAVQRLEIKNSTVEEDFKMQLERIKKKAQKISQQKTNVEARLDQEKNINSELQKEMHSLRASLKTAEKRLNDHDMRRETRSSMNQDARKAQDLQVLLDRETLRRRQLEKDNINLGEELASLKRSEQWHLDELQELRRKMDFTQRDELQQVNLLLETQAASQKAKDQINANNLASLQSQLEQRIRTLESEVTRAQTTLMDSLSQQNSIRIELDKYKSMYSEESLLRKSLATKLERANTRLTDTNSKLLTERTKFLIASSSLNFSPENQGLNQGL